jgi:hypothetical protein
MVERQFSEVDLRHMLEYADGLSEDDVEGRWLVGTRHERHPWAVVVEPDFEAKVLVVITAYRVE